MSSYSQNYSSGYSVNDSTLIVDCNNPITLCDLNKFQNFIYDKFEALFLELSSLKVKQQTLETNQVNILNKLNSIDSKVDSKTQIVLSKFDNLNLNSVISEVTKLSLNLDYYSDSILTQIGLANSKLDSVVYNVVENVNSKLNDFKNQIFVELYKISVPDFTPILNEITYISSKIDNNFLDLNTLLTTVSYRVDDNSSILLNVFGGEPTDIILYFRDDFDSLSNKIDNINLTPITTQITNLNDSCTSKLDSISDKIVLIDTKVTATKNYLELDIRQLIENKSGSVASSLNSWGNTITSRMNSNTIYIFDTLNQRSDSILSSIGSISFVPITNQLNTISSNLTTYKSSIESKIDNINLTPITDNLNALSENISNYYLDLKTQIDLLNPPEITIKSLNGNFGTYPDNTLVNTTTYGNDWLVLGSFMSDFNNQAMPMYKLKKGETIRFTPAYFLE